MSYVRFATPEDIPALIELAREMHVNSRYAWMRFDAARLWKVLEVAIQDRGQCVMLASDSPEPGERAFAGLWAKVVSPEFTSELFAEVNYLYISRTRKGSPAVMKMMAGLRIWTNNRNCCCLRLNQTSIGIDSNTNKFSRRLGFEVAGRFLELMIAR